MKKIGLYLLMSFVILVMSWEYQRSVAASILDIDFIPEDAIRLRVLAHSDLPQDQWLKREVRDSVIQQVITWIEDIESSDEAQDKIEQSLQELDSIVQQTIQRYGFDYSFTIEYGQVAFPSKLYGNQYYPAGEYEGVVITIGEGQGDNWWCVLFPPLCFIDFGTGEVLDPDQEAKEDEQKVEVRFFLAELFQKLKLLFV